MTATFRIADGHYARPDLFELTVHRKQQPMMRVDDMPDSGSDDTHQ